MHGRSRRRSVGEGREVGGKWGCVVCRCGVGAGGGRPPEFWDPGSRFKVPPPPTCLECRAQAGCRKMVKPLMAR